MSDTTHRDTSDTSHYDTSRTSHCDTSTRAPTKVTGSAAANRRRFLLAFGAGAAGAASASALAAAPVAIVEPAASKPVSQGYQETDHVRRYYATTRL